jgi:hypothetical protein
MADAVMKDTSRIGDTETVLKRAGEDGRDDFPSCAVVISGNWCGAIFAATLPNRTAPA